MKNWYTIYETDTGAYIGHGSVLPDIVSDTHTVLDHGESDQMDQDSIWNASTKQWDKRPLDRRIRVSELLTRLTEVERFKYYALDNANGRMLEKAISSAERIGYVDLDSDSISGMLDILILESVITAGRKTEILL